MKKLSFPIVCDALFLFVSGGMLAFVVARFYLSPLLSLFLATAAGILLCLVFLRRRSRAYVGAALKKTEEAECQSLLSALPVLSKQESAAVRAALSESAGKTAAFYFCFAPMSKDRAAAFLRMETPPTALFATALSDEARQLLSSFGVAVTEGAGIYRVLKEKNALPPLPQKVRRKSFRTVLRTAFRKKNAARFLAYGVLFFAMSMIVPYPVYYVICGGLFLTYAVISRLLGSSD